MQKALIIAFFLFCFPALSALPPRTYFFTQEGIGSNSGLTGVHFSVYQLDYTNKLVKGIEGTIPTLLRDVVILNDGTNVSIFGINPSSNLVHIRQTGPTAFNMTTGNDTVRALTQVNNSIITVGENNCIIERDMDGQHIATLGNQNWLDPITDGHIKQIQVLSTILKKRRSKVSRLAILTDKGQFMVTELLVTPGNPYILHKMQLPSSIPRVRFISDDYYAWFLQEGAQPWRYYYHTQSVTIFTARSARIGAIEKQIPLALDSHSPLLTMRWGQDLVTIDASANTVFAMDATFFHPHRLTQMGFQGVLQQTADLITILPPAGLNCGQYLLSQSAIQPAPLSSTQPWNSGKAVVQPNSATSNTKNPSQDPVKLSEFQELMRTEAKKNSLRPLDEEVTTAAQLANWINQTSKLKSYFGDVLPSQLASYGFRYRLGILAPIPGQEQKKIQVTKILQLLSDAQKTKP